MIVLRVSGCVFVIMCAWHLYFSIIYIKQNESNFNSISYMLLKNLIQSNRNHKMNWVPKVGLPTGSLELGQHFGIEEGIEDYGEVTSLALGRLLSPQYHQCIHFLKKL